VVFVLLGVAVICVIWIAANFMFKMTMKVFALGCLGIAFVGLLCAASVYFGGS
jgi:hypothetical protein